MIDTEFEWDQYRYQLDKIFFHEDGILKRGSSEILDFWNFLKKFLTFARKQSRNKNHSKHSENKDAVSQKKINFRLKLQRDPTAVADMSGKRKQLAKFCYLSFSSINFLCLGVERILNEDKLLQFEKIILHYMDFVQKQKVSSSNATRFYYLFCKYLHLLCCVSLTLNGSVHSIH